MKANLRRAIARFGYPLFLAWPVLLTGIALRRHLIPEAGTAAFAGKMLLSLCGMAPIACAVIVLERKMPSRDQRVSAEDLRTDLTHLAILWIVLAPLSQAMMGSIAAVGGGWLSTRMGVGLWPSTWPVELQLLLALVVADFGHYWFHRFAHETDLGWRIHAVHHGTPQVYWLNSTRFHALEVFIKHVFQIGPLIVIGCSPEAFLAYGAFTAVNGWVQHSNVDYDTRGLNWIFSTPELHRWHHSVVVDEANRNYGVVLLCWDHLFGSYLWPRDRSFTGPIGIGDMPDFPKTYLAQQLSAFRWNQLPRLRSDEKIAPAEEQQDEALARRTA